MSKLYNTDLDDAAWAVIEPELPAASPGGRPRTTNLRAVVNAIFYLLRTGRQWRLLPRKYPPRSTVYHYFSVWRTRGVWTRLQRILHRRVRLAAGRRECPTVVIMDGQSVKTTERSGTRGFDGHKRVKGRKRNILVDTLGLPLASRAVLSRRISRTAKLGTDCLAVCALRSPTFGSSSLMSPMRAENSRGSCGDITATNSRSSSGSSEHSKSPA